jgi:methionyl-tRNA formyltransferase
MIVAAVEGLAAGTLHSRPQPAQGVTTAAKLSRAEARLDWRRPAADLERQVRAFAPWPGATFQASGQTIKVLSADVVEGGGGAAPGAILDDRLTIACGGGALRPTRLQRGGRAACDAAALLRGFPIPPGTRLAVPEAPA